MSAVPILVSHRLCPYVQRAAIVLAEKGVAFERRDVDLAAKPDWFLRLSPTGKTPMLLVDGEALFESAAICEYLDETALPRLHPANAVQRARHRGWIEYGSGLLNLIGAFYSAPDEDALRQRAQEVHARFATLESVLGEGPYFDGAFSLVDAVFGPVFRYFDVFEAIGDFGFFDGLPKVAAWRRALADRPSVRGAADPRYPELLHAFLRRRDSALGRRLCAVDAEA
ncbi:MAG: glutathione S-transferase family protein [Piscinibacter sp.]|nr:glutathione S-transferase family protein [Piscinibacter sp.]